MMQCWRKYASERPRFEDICRYLDGILEDMKRESYCESDSDDEDTLSREGSRKFPSRTPSFKSGVYKICTFTPKLSHTNQAMHVCWKTPSTKLK